MKHMFIIKRLNELDSFLDLIVNKDISKEEKLERYKKARRTITVIRYFIALNKKNI